MEHNNDGSFSIDFTKNSSKEVMYVNGEEGKFEFKLTKDMIKELSEKEKLENDDYINKYGI